MKFKNKLRKPADVFERNQLKVARDSMRLSCSGCLILGGPNHYESARIIERITGAIVGIDSECTCNKTIEV